MSVADLPSLRDERDEWMRDAACRGVGLDDPDLFFPEQMTSEKAATAVAMCNRCPVQEACMKFAIVNGEEYGIWGGLSPRARREITSILSRQPRQRELATYNRYLEHKRAGRNDPIKATSRDMHVSTATVYHHIRLIKFKAIFGDWNKETK